MTGGSVLEVAVTASLFMVLKSNDYSLTQPLLQGAVFPKTEMSQRGAVYITALNRIQVSPEKNTGK